MSKLSPTQKTLAFLRAAGYTCEIVEKQNAYAGPPSMRCHVCGKNKIGVKQDLMGWCDIIAMRSKQQGILGIQCTSGAGGNLSARRKKIIAEPRAKLWIETGNRIWLMGWVVDKKDPRLEEIVLADFEEVATA